MHLNIKKIILINVSLFLAAFFAIEFISYKILYNENKTTLEKFAELDKNFFEPALKYERPVLLSYEERCKQMRPVSYGAPDKKSIALFGCSYTWGSWLEYDEIFSAQLSKYTGRTVYNRGICASGPALLLYQLSDFNIANDIKNPEYIIYTIIDDHFNRLLSSRSWVCEPVIQYQYKLKNGRLELIEPKFTFLYPLFSAYRFQRYIQNRDFQNHKYKDLALSIFKESHKLIKQKFPDAKFVILVYQDAIVQHPEVKADIFKQLEDDGIIVLYTDELLGGKNVLAGAEYKSADGYHPSKAAWERIVPKLAERLNLN